MMKNNKRKMVTEDFISFKDFVKGGVLKLKSVWTSLKSKISSLFSRELKDAEIGDEVKVTIPIEMKTEIEKELKEAELSVIQGNYNEVLVLLLLYTLSVPGIKIAKKYEKYRDDIIKSVQKWKNDLKTKVSSSQFAKAETIIQKGSEEMARYLVTEAVKNDSVIIGGYSDNLSFQRGGISSKADIQLFLKKNGKELLQGYSLKLYTGKQVGLANTTASALATHLAGPKAGEAVKKAIKEDAKLKIHIEVAKRYDQIKQALKALKRGNSDDDIAKAKRALTKLGYTETGMLALDINVIDQKRKESRKPINPRIAEIIEKVLKPYSKKPEFAENILKIMGFTDKDTKMLMSVITFNKKGIKSEIIDEHPELDLNKIKLERSGVSLNIKDSAGRTIASFGVKEGEKQAVSGKVSFADVEPYDFIDSAEIFNNNFKYNEEE
jgi:hypothetical protein